MFKLPPINKKAIFKRFILFICIHTLIYLLKRIWKREDRQQKPTEYFYSENLLNIYDEPLEKCKESNMQNGSWDSEGKCSEKGGGVHQICIRNISQNTPKFSQQTGQSDWSDKRGTDNHCVCLGAWSLYNAKEEKNSKDNKNKQKNKKKVLKCEAIPKIALSKDYVSKFSKGWNKWNGLELNDQIKNGVEGLVDNCYQPDEAKSEKLKKNYCDFSSEVEVLKNSDTYRKLCQ